MVPQIYKTEGIIIRRTNSGEKDRIITVFTRELGKIRVFAKGVRSIKSRRGGHLEVFRWVRLIIRKGRVADYICEAHTINDYDIENWNLMRISYAYYICELINQLCAEGQSDIELFKLLDNSLIAVRRAGNYREIDDILTAHALALLTRTGFLPKTNARDNIDVVSFVENITQKPFKSSRIISKLQQKE